MRRTSALLLAGLTAVVLLPPSASASDAPVCTTADGALELVTGGFTPIVAGADRVQGFVLRRGSGTAPRCAVAGVEVELLARTKNDSRQVLVRRGTTDAAGRVQFQVTPPFTTVLTGRATATSGSATQTVTAVSQVPVGTRVTLTSRALSGCRVEVHGRTYPAKPGSRLHVTTSAAELARVPVRADGTYGAVLGRPCADRSAVVVSIDPTARNEHGSSTAPELPDRTPGTCGTGVTGRGPDGLVQTFEPFNTSTAVGGTWVGERVLTNASSSPVTYREGSSFSQSTPYRLLRSGTQDVLGQEGFTDAGSPRSPVTLAPGEQARVVVVLDARNCYAPRPPGYVAFASSPGAPLPPGRVVGTTVVELVDGTAWASDRVALEVVGPVGAQR